jgi:MFS family permease
MNKNEKKIMKLTIGSHSTVHFFEGVLPPIIPILIIQFNTDYFHLGIIVSIFSYAFGIGAIPGGILSDKMRPRILISIFLLGAGLFSLFIIPASSLLFYGIIMGMLGAFCSIYHPAANTLISHAIKEKGAAFGYHGIAGSLGVAITPFLSAWLGASYFGWKTPHIIFGIIAILIGIYSLSVPHAGHNTAFEPDSNLDNNLDTNRDVAEENNQKKRNYMPLIIFFITATGLGLTYKGIMTFLPAYIGENIHILNIDKVAIGGYITTLALISGALGQYVSGKIVDKYPPEKIYFLLIILGTFFVFLMAFAKNYPAVLIAAAVLYALFYFAVQPVQNYIISTYLPPHRHGIGYGMLFFVTFGIGSTAAAVSGYIADKLGLEFVFYSMGACYLFAAFFSFILIYKKKQVSMN